MGDEIQRVQVVPLDVVTLPFYGTVAANSATTLVSKRITCRFTTERFRVHFALNSNKQLRVKFYLSPDDSAPTSEPLTGYNVFGFEGQVDYVVGDDETVEIPHRVKVTERGYYVKVFADNRDSYEHSIDAQVFIVREEAEE